MSIRDMPEPAVRAIAWKYFLGGFLLLPWLWLVNFVYIYPETKRRSELSGTVRRLALASLAGSVLALIVTLTWMSVYFKHRREWGAAGDNLSQNVPWGS